MADLCAPSAPGLRSDETQPQLANDLRPGQPRDGRSTRLQHDFSPGGPEPTSRNLRSVGLQAAHYRDLDSDEIRIGALSQHLIVLFTKPPAEMTIRCEGVKRDLPPPVGSIALVPAGGRRVERAQQLLCGRQEVSLAEVAISA